MKKEKKTCQYSRMRTNHVKTGVQSTHKMSNTQNTSENEDYVQSTHKMSLTHTHTHTHTHNILQIMKTNNVQHQTDIMHPLIYYICQKLVTVLRHVKIPEV
jgi:hypothetical protein